MKIQYIVVPIMMVLVGAGCSEKELQGRNEMRREKDVSQYNLKKTEVGRTIDIQDIVFLNLPSNYSFRVDDRGGQLYFSVVDDRGAKLLKPGFQGEFVSIFDITITKNLKNLTPRQFIKEYYNGSESNDTTAKDVVIDGRAGLEFDSSLSFADGHYTIIPTKHLGQNLFVVIRQDNIGDSAGAAKELIKGLKFNTF